MTAAAYFVSIIQSRFASHEAYHNDFEVNNTKPEVNGEVKETSGETPGTKTLDERGSAASQVETQVRGSRLLLRAAGLHLSDLLSITNCLCFESMVNNQNEKKTPRGQRQF